MKGKRSRIFVVNDHHNFGRVVERILRPEHDVLLVPRMEAALARIEAGEPFDLLLCELIGPGLSGLAFHERVGSIAPEQGGRIVFITAGAASESTKAFLDQRNVYWIEKPLISLAAFRAAVREHLDRLGGGAAQEGEER